MTVASRMENARIELNSPTTQSYLRPPASPFQRRRLRFKDPMIRFGDLTRCWLKLAAQIPMWLERRVDQLVLVIEAVFFATDLGDSTDLTSSS